MSFRLFGVDVEIQLSFFVLAMFMSAGYIEAGRMREALVIVGVVLVSLLAHEYGHALAVKRHKIEPEIALHWRGGTTSYRILLPLRRIDHVVISLAGPLAGFALALVVYGVRRFVLEPSHVFQSMHPLGRLAFAQLEFINLYWGLFNLLPVLPFDGGHVLEHALGPKRVRVTSGISFVVGAAAAVFFIQAKVYFGAYFCAMGAIASLQRLMSTAPVARGAAARTPSAADAGGDVRDLPADLAAMLREARRALSDEDLDRAAAFGERLLSAAELASSPAREKASSAALHVLAWARYLSGRVDEAEALLQRAARLGPVDAALSGALLMARQKFGEARRVLEGARAAGDDRKEVVGPLIQVLLEQREVARAAAVALDVVDSLSDEDVRRMVDLSFEGGASDASAYDWSARLSEALFARDRRAEDAYAAARALAKHGDVDRALVMLKAAVEAGFTDRSRVWSDAALSSLREDSSALEAVLPRP